MAVRASHARIVDRAQAQHRRARLAFGRLLLAAGLIVGVVAALMPAASAIPRPDSIDEDDWTDGWHGGDPWPPTASADWPVPTANPGIAARCGIDIAVVIDRSGSIADAGQGSSYKSAVKDLVDAFAGTPSNLGVWSFGSYASDTDPVDYPWAQMAALDGPGGPANVTALKATVDGIPIVSNEATNWEEGIRAILSPPVAASPAPELLVVLTDGQPTVHADDHSSGGTVNNDDMAGGILSANLVKASGTRILAVGVGPNVAVDGLKLLSGPTAFDGTNIDTADYLTTSFADLSASLEEFATAVCGASVTVIKEVSTLADPATFAPAPGWTFTGAIDDPPPSASADPDQPATPATNDGLTGDDGEITFRWSSPGSETVTITESQQQGFELVGIECELDGQSFPGEEDADGITLTIAQGAQVECTFRNRPVFIDLSVTKSDAQDVVVPGQVLDYVIDYANAADATAVATDVILTEVVPANTSYVASGSDPWSCPDGASAGAVCTLDVGDLAPGASGTAHFVVEVVDPVPADATEVANTVAVTGTGTERDEADQEATDVDAIDASPIITVDKENVGNDDVVEPGEVIRYAITVANTGDRDAEGVVVTETVPALTTFDPSAPDNDVWTDEGGGIWSTTVDVPAGGSVTLHFTVVVDTAVPADAYLVENTVTACRPLPFPGLPAVLPGIDFPFPFPLEICDDGTDDDWIDAHAVITVDKENEGNDDVVEPGETIVYVITVANDGNRDAEDIFVRETLPANTSFDPSDPGNDVWTDLGGGEYMTVVDVEAFETVVLTFTVTVDAVLPAGVASIHNDVAACPPIVLDAVLPSLQSFLLPGVELCVTADDDDDLDAAPDLVVTKDDGGVSARPGDQVTYTITYANTGDQDATGVVLTETVPTGTSFVGPDTWVCTGATCTYDIGDLAAGASGSVAFTVRVDATLPVAQTDVDNLVVIDDDGDNGADPNPSDNTDTDSTPVTRPVTVLPNVIEPPATSQPTQVQGVQLPRTGQDSDRLLLLAGVLTMLGGALLVGESFLEQRRRRVLPTRH